MVVLLLRVVALCSLVEVCHHQDYNTEDSHLYKYCALFSVVKCNELYDYKIH